MSLAFNGRAIRICSLLSVYFIQSHIFFSFFMLFVRWNKNRGVIMWANVFEGKQKGFEEKIRQRTPTQNFLKFLSNTLFLIPTEVSAYLSPLINPEFLKLNKLISRSVLLFLCCLITTMALYFKNFKLTLTKNIKYYYGFSWDLLITLKYSNF